MVATEIAFYYFDPEEWEEIPMGTVTIDGSSITSDNPDLLDIVLPGTTEEAAKEFYADWSNGYIGSKIQETVVATGMIGLSVKEPMNQLREVKDVYLGQPE